MTPASRIHEITWGSTPLPIATRRTVAGSRPHRSQAAEIRSRTDSRFASTRSLVGSNAPTLARTSGGSTARRDVAPATGATREPRVPAKVGPARLRGGGRTPPHPPPPPAVFGP